MRGFYCRSLAEQHGSFYQIAQLSNIAGERILLEKELGRIA